MALLQECPPRFCAPLARACGAEAHRALTSRNSLGALRALAARAQPRPDRLRRGRLEPDPGPLFRCALCAQRNHATDGAAGGSPSGASWRSTRAGPSGGRWPSPAPPSGLCVANLHATNDRPELADRGRAARRGGRDRLGGRGAAALRRRPQPAAGREPRGLRRAARALRPRRADRPATRSTTCWSAGWRRSSRRASWPPERRELREDGLRPAPLRPRPGRGRFADPDPKVVR